MARQRPEAIRSKIISNATKPKMSRHRGRTWQRTGVTLLDGTEVNAYIDTTWGRNIYFPYNGRWYKIHIDDTQDIWNVRLNNNES